MFLVGLNLQLKKWQQSGQPGYWQFQKDQNDQQGKVLSRLHYHLRVITLAR